MFALVFCDFKNYCQKFERNNFFIKYNNIILKMLFKGTD